MVRYLNFRKMTDKGPEITKRSKQAASAIFILFLIPSIWSAFNLIRENNFERNVQVFLENNRVAGPHSYVYDFSVKRRHATIDIAGDPLTDSLRTVYLDKLGQFGIKEKNVTIREHTFGLSQEQMSSMINEIYTRTDLELARNAAMLDSVEVRLNALQARLDSLTAPSDSLAARPDSLILSNLNN